MCITSLNLFDLSRKKKFQNQAAWPLANIPEIWFSKWGELARGIGRSISRLGKGKGEIRSEEHSLRGGEMLYFSNDHVAGLNARHEINQSPRTHEKYHLLL